MGADYFESREDLAAEPPAAESRRSASAGTAEIRNAIIDKNARIGDGVRLVNARRRRGRDADDYVIVDGIIVVPKHAVIPDGTVI